MPPLSPPQVAVRPALLDRLIPADEFSGALEAGVADCTRPHSGVTDRWGRGRGHDHLFVCAGSLHVTNGGLNPGLTVMALAFRSAGHIQGNA